MRNKLLAALTAGLMMAGLFGGAALAGHGGAHEPQDKGLCTAYFNGQKKGHGKNGKDQPPPFQSLTERAGDADGDDTPGTVNDIATFCGSLVGGNPDHGRYPGCFDEDTEAGCPGQE